MYKEASKLKLRFTTSVGQLSTEQLWDLNQSQLSVALVAVNKILKKSEDNDLSFLDVDKKVDYLNELRFNILKDVYLSKKEEAERIKNIAETKAYNEKINSLIAEKKEGQLRDMSVEELEKLLRR